MQLDQLRERNEKLVHQVQEVTIQKKRDTDAVEKRHEDVVSGFERQSRELRSQITMKNKDISTLREDTNDLEQRLATKTGELR